MALKPCIHIETLRMETLMSGRRKQEAEEPLGHKLPLKPFSLTKYIITLTFKTD